MAGLVSQSPMTRSFDYAITRSSITRLFRCFLNAETSCSELRSPDHPITRFFVNYSITKSKGRPKGRPFLPITNNQIPTTVLQKMYPKLAARLLDQFKIRFARWKLVQFAKQFFRPRGLQHNERTRAFLAHFEGMRYAFR